MYTFSIEKNNLILVKVVVMSEIIETDSYFRNLVEKCFERVFTIIRDVEKKNSSEEVDLDEEED